MKALWRNYSLSITLFILFAVSWMLQTYSGWVHFVGEQRELGQTPLWLGEGGYFWHWTETTMENWQSEFLQLLTFVILTSFLIHRGSHESKDSDEEMRAAIERLEQGMKRLEAQRGVSEPGGERPAPPPRVF